MVKISAVSSPKQLADYLLTDIVQNSVESVNLPTEDRKILLNWTREVDQDQLVKYITKLQEAIENNARYPRMSGAQEKIIIEAQEDAGTDFLSKFLGLTSWQADVIIKGCIAVSEITRQTDKRYFPLSWLRSAISSFLLNDSPNYTNQELYQYKYLPVKGKATDRQIEAIYDLQPEVQADFTEFYYLLDSVQADIILKGMVIISEIKRVKKTRNMSLRDIRYALRKYIQARPETDKER